MKIFPYCDTFFLVQRKGTQKIDERLDQWKISDAFDPVQWPTAAYRKNAREVFTYSCCSESLEALMNLSELCEGEMIFSRKKLCIAYTLPAEKNIVLDVFYLFWEHRCILDPNPPWESEKIEKITG